MYENAAERKIMCGVQAEKKNKKEESVCYQNSV